MKDRTTTSSKMKHLLFLGIIFSAFQISHSFIPDFCVLDPNEGHGSNFNFAVYYDFTKDQCSPFIYKGQGGNANRFENEKDCMRNCSTNAENVYPKNVTKACLLKKEYGGCNGKYLRFYYDSSHGKCKAFFWTGCLGNGNRFFDYFTCNSTCAGIHDEGEKNGLQEEEDERDTPIAIICGVLLAVIIVAIIVTVTVLMVKSKKKSAKKKGAGKTKDPQSEAPLQDRGIEMA